MGVITVAIFTCLQTLLLYFYYLWHYHFQYYSADFGLMDGVMLSPT